MTAEQRVKERDRLLFRRLLAVFLSMLLMGVISIGTSYAIVRYFERQWCDTLTTLTEGYTQPAATPPSDRAQRLAADLIELRRRYGC